MSKKIYWIAQLVVLVFISCVIIATNGICLSSFLLLGANGISTILTALAMTTQK